jgi:hypothetical protein
VALAVLAEPVAEGVLVVKVIGSAATHLMDQQEVSVNQVSRVGMEDLAIADWTVQSAKWQLQKLQASR